MKKVLFYILACLLVGLTSCIDEDFVIKGKLGEGETMATLSFTHNSFEKIDVKSRATLNEIAESRIENIFVYIFDHTGKRAYSHFFDESSKVNSIPTDIGNFWTISNRTSTNNNNTAGEARMKVPILEGGSVYVIANLNADMMNISADELYLVETVEDLKKLEITLSQEITSRSGYFLMSGGVTGISINESGNITKDNQKVKVYLDRLDAKVSVTLKLGESKIANQELRRFIPESWQVMRLPKGCKVIAGEGNADDMGFFDEEEHFFEDINSTNNEFGFSFYVLENKKRSTGLTAYHQREQRHKKPDGTYDLTKGMWEHVDDNATYMVVKGRLQMVVDTHNLFEMQHLEADVTYFIHLGDFGSSVNGGGDVNDFSANRNTHYNYTITIRGVDNIEVEVVKDIENQSGAIGDIYKSREEIFTYDAHYGQRVYTVDSRDVDASTLTWYVKTPFGEGRPGIEFGTENPNLDYKWAWFMVNTEDNGYSKKNHWYPGDDYQKRNYNNNDRLWDVMEFTEWLRAEKIKFDNAPDSEKGTASAFRYIESEDRYVIYVTVFVDEFFYNANPLNPNDAPQDFWKQFVNKPNRIMHVLCDSKESKDGDSSLTNSVITLRQRSIQTVYNTSNTELMAAWGCETVDEFIPSQLFYFSTTEKVDNYNTTSPYESKLGQLGNASDHNGLYNSLKMWNITPGVSRWDEFFDYERENDFVSSVTNTPIYFLGNNEEESKNASEKLTLRYSSLMRNRDCDGDRIIDEDELRWYIATLPQLYELFIGEPGLDPDAYIFTSEMNAHEADEVFESGPYAGSRSLQGARKWRNHIIPSTWVTKNYSSFPQVLWAEESFSLSSYQQTASWGDVTLFAPLSTRSVRNLGVPSPTIDNEGIEGTNSPEGIIKETYDDTNKSYYFDLSNLNTKSLRYFTTHELEIGDENFETSKVYYGFETGVPFKKYNVSSDNNKTNYGNLISDLEAGNHICPTGYRVPNVRECAIMTLYCTDTWWQNVVGSKNDWVALVSTEYSNNGATGDKNGKNKNANSWQFGYRMVTLGASSAGTIIPVKDVRK